MKATVQTGSEQTNRDEKKERWAEEGRNEKETAPSAFLPPDTMKVAQKSVVRGRAKEPEQQEEFSGLINRVREIVWHIPWYGFKSQARLAHDSGVSPAAVSRLMRGRTQPTLPIALRVTGALSRRLGRPLDVCEVFSLDGSFPTPSVCHLTGCRNCLPPAAYDRDENLRPEFQGVPSGGWDQVNLNQVKLNQVKMNRVVLASEEGR